MKITQEEYLRLRDITVKELKDFSHREDIVLTCDDCIFRFECEFAADGYNTDGDCLALK